jgi:outer membrane receptor protein involved in Fe transport
MPLATRTLSAAAPLAAALTLLLLAAPLAAAQTGTLAGTVIDGETGETIIGANVSIPGTTLGTVTDLDGRFHLRLAPDSYSVAFSYIGYDVQTVTDVVITAGQTVTLDVVLSSTALGLGEIVVQAEAILSGEASLLRVQARAPAIMDGISAQQIRRSPDANSGEALRRVTGVQVSGGKFVFVRGIPERYNGTLLNGSPVASTEPDRRAFAYDLIPSNLLENVMVAKSATPDLPGDFAGGMLQIATIDFPERFTASLNLASGVTSATGSTLLSAPRGALDYLGIDDGTRALPAAFPNQNISSADFSDIDRANLGRSLGNGWGLTPNQGPLTPNFSASVGGSTEGSYGRVGAVASLTYRSSYGLTEMIRREFEGPDQLRFDYTGSQSRFNVTWGGLMNVSYRPTPHHSISFKNFYSRTADDEVSRLVGGQFTDSGAEQQLTAIRFLSRDVYSGQLIGEHFLRNAAGLQLRWDLSRSVTSRSEPDYRRAVYQRVFDAPDDEPFRLLVGPTVSIKNGGRFYSDMGEGTWGAALRGTLPLGLVRLSAGASGHLTDRDFESRLLAAVRPRRDFDNALLALPLEEVFHPRNFGRLDRPGCENGGSRCEGFLLAESQTGGTDYTAGQRVVAGYTMIDAPLAPISSRLRFVGGLRLEHAVQELESTTFSGDTLDVRSPYTNLLPSVNLTFAASERTNVRFAYSRNVNRPELRELAPFQYYDFELQTTVYGNDSLRQAVINNLDLRVETYPAAGQLLSASVFYKHFRDPIERAIVPGVALNAERTFTNADVATNFGFELEARRGLGFLTPYLHESSVVLNYTRIWSEVEVRATAQTLPRAGRPLQGQSPYVMNAGVNFVEPRWRTSVSVLYNRLGSRVIEVATANDDDVVERARDVLDLALIQPLGSRYEVRLTARDVLNQPQQFVQSGELVRENRIGRSLSFGVTARL